jgi:rhodanese-related sulfurtransferase
MPPFQLQELDAQTTKSLVDRGEAVLIDVREPQEHARERIPGVALIPMSAFDLERIKAAAGTKKVVFFCAVGARSARAAEAVAAAGVTNVAHLKGGLPTWRAAGYDVAVG